MPMEAKQRNECLSLSDNGSIERDLRNDQKESSLRRETVLSYRKSVQSLSRSRHSACLLDRQKGVSRLSGQIEVRRSIRSDRIVSLRK